MKHLFFPFAFLFYVFSPLFAADQPKIDRGHNQLEVESLQSIEISPVLDMPSNSTVDMVSKDDGTIYHVSQHTVLTIRDFTGAMEAIKNGISALELQLTPSGTKKIRKHTARSVGRQLAFIVNGKLLKAPTVKIPIEGGGLSIDPVDNDSAQKLAKLINAG